MKTPVCILRITAPVFALAAAVILAACVNVAGGDQHGGGGPTITLALPGSEEIRTAYPGAGGLPAADVLAALQYRFDLAGPGGVKRAESAQGVSTVSFKVPVAGKWDITVEAWLNGRALYASGSAAVDVAEYGTSRVSVPLKKEAGIGEYTVSGRITSEYGAESGMPVRLMQGGSGFYLEAYTDSDGNYIIRNVDAGSGNVIEIPAGYMPAASPLFTVSGNVTQDLLNTRTVESIEEFGADAAVTGLIVASAADWTDALNAIAGGGNDKNYAIKVTGGVTGISGVTSVSFSNGVSDIKVALLGGGSLELGSNGALVYLGTGQTLILRNVKLMGKDSNSSAVILMDGGDMIMRAGEITGNRNPNFGSEGGGVKVTGGSFKMLGGTISDNTVHSDGGGVHISGSGSSFTKTGGTIYGNNAPNSLKNTVIFASGSGHAVYYSSSPTKYRNDTHSPNDGTLSTTNTGSGWLP